MSSADPTPIPSARFATALKELSVEMLHLKVLEIRNSIAHLQYSNDQLKPFAEGTSVAAAASDGASNTTTTSQPPAEPDQDCIDAIRENEQVIDRMAERIALIRIEVEERGVSWTEFQSKDEVDERQRQQQQQQQGNPASDAAHPNSTNGQVNGGSHGAEQQQQHSAWADGTFQTGTIRNGQVQFDAQPGRPQGGTLSDEQLRQALEQRMRELSSDDTDDADGGMHL